jgi:hypothetical protein
MTAFQTFLSAPLAFKHLDRPAFSRLQTVTFPHYFALQTILPVVIALSFPRYGTRASLVAELFSKTNFWAAGVPLAGMLVCGGLNWGVVGPMAQATKRERDAQGNCALHDTLGMRNVGANHGYVQNVRMARNPMLKDHIQKI